MKLITVFGIFFHFGLLCFGGGYVLTPIYIEELVEGRGWMTLAEFGNFLAITQITPGPVSINAATFFGFRHAGILGAISATAGLLAPSLILMTLVLHGMRRWSESRLMKGLIWGVSPATIGLMVAALVIFLEMSVFSGKIPWGTFIDALTLKPTVWPEGLRVRPVAVLICGVCTYAMCKTKIKITTLIFLSAVLGALLFPLLGN